jgi:hypothetical protein
MFVSELTIRSWINTEENQRRKLECNDIAAAITKTVRLGRCCSPHHPLHLSPLFCSQIAAPPHQRERGLFMDASVGLPVGNESGVYFRGGHR